MDSREERQKQADAAFRSSGFGMPKIAPSPIQQEADAAASLVNAKPVTPAPTLWEQVRDSEIGRSYFWGKEDYSRRAKEIADRLQVSPDVVSIAGEESLKRWEDTFQTLEMGKRDDEFAQTWSDWNDISQTERAIRVHNYSDVKQTMSVVDNITSGIRQMDAQIKLSAMGNERMELEAKGANTDELDAKIQNLQKYIMSQSGDGGIIHDTSSQLYMMANQSVNSGKEIMIGSLMGAAAGAAAGGVGAIPGFITGAGLGYRAGLFNRMNEMERGLSYLEYRSGGEYGKMSAETAAKAATAVGITNAAIEFASFGMGLRALSLGASKLAGRATATGAQSIIRNAARSIASARSVGEASKIFAKSSAIGVASETSEEVMQQATQDIAWNMSADPSEGTRKMPVTEIISNAVDAGITAAPTILGMSVVLGTGANLRFVSKAARMLQPDYEIQKEMAVHTVGAQMLRDLEADKQTSALFKKDPELYTKSVQEAADKQGLGAFFVDANALMETEDGRNILNSMVSNNVVSEQALQTAIETEGRLEVPVGVYLQEDFTEQQRAAVDKASAWTQDGATQAEMTAHWENMAASKYAQELQDDIDRMINATDRVLSDKFSAADEADKETIRQVLVANPLDLNAARKTVRKGIVDNIEQTFSDTISVMRTDLADGEIQLIPGRDTVYDQDRMLRASSNPQWYKDFYATHKRRPRIDEFYDIMLDEEEKQVQRYYSNGVIRSEQDYEDALQQIENGRKMVESLRTIDAYKDTFDELQKEKAVSLRMYLSPDEMKVYDDVKKYMDSVGGDAQESAHQAAYLWAKRAKVFTQMMHDMGHTDFVATDYLDMHPLFTMNEYTPDAADKMAAQYLQQNKTVTFITEEERAEFGREGERFVAVLNDDTVSKNEVIRLTAAPEILTALGYTNKDIVISKGLALNTMNAPGTSAHAHAMTAKMLAQIPAALHEPVFVLKSATRKRDSIVVFTDIRDEQDRSVIVPIRFTKNKLGHANQISSMYPRTREELFMLKQMMSDNLVYISTRKGPLWAKNARLQLPRTLLKESLNYELKIARKKGDVKHYRGNYYFQAETQGRPLVALHNTTAEKIRHIAELGGIAVPSIAITRADVPYNRFGNITLIAGSDFINPKKKENPTFDTDVYSPRYPQVYDYKLEKGAEKELVSVFAPLVKKFSGEDIGAGALADLKRAMAGGLDGVLSKGGLDENETAQKAWFATKGLTAKDLPNTEARYKYWMDHHSEIKEWLAPLYRAIPKQARILTGYTASGRQRFKDYTLDNIVKIMRGKSRNEEGMYYGVGNIRAAHAKKYKTLTEVQNDRNRITSHEDMETWKEKLNEKWESLTQKAGGAKAEIIADIVLNSPKSKWQNELDKENITGINANALSDFVNDITSAPAEYFEVKKQRAVGLDEFYAAIVPKGTTRETRKILRDAGLRVVTYDGKNRNEVLLKTAQQLQKKHGDVLFQRQQERHIRGMTALRDGRQMLFLFRKDANFSTFVHESGHIFLEDLQRMAAQENAPEWLKKDWQTVKEWTGWKDGADNRAAHEKWARGFEAYVREGNAPSRDLKAVFRRFRRWLVGIYQNLLDLGEIPPESIRNVMDRMLATQEEIDAYTAEKALDTMQGVDTKLAARLAKLKARAAEKVEKDVEAKIRKGVEEVLEDAVKSWRAARTEELRKEEIYKHEALAKQFGEDVLNKYYTDAAAFKKALEDAGGPLEERLKREEQEQRKAFTDELMNPESIRAQVEEYMTGELGQADLLEAETRYIARERNKLAGEYMKQLRKLNDNPQRGNPKRRLHPGELPESPTRDELLARPDVQVVDVALPENSPLVPSAELRAAQQTRDEAYAAGKRGKSLPDNPYWKEYRAQAKAWLKEHVPDTILNRELGRITVNRKSLDHALNSIRGNGFVRLAILADLENVLANSVVTHVSRVTHGNVTNKKVFIAHGPVRVHGSTYLAKHVIKEAAGGRFYYDTQSTEIKIAEPLASYAGKTTVANDANVLSNFSTISIEEMLKHVKSEDQPLADGYLTEAERLAEVLSYLRSELKGHEGARESVKDAQKQLSKIRQQERAAVQELEREQTLVKQLKESNAEDAEEHAQKLAEMRQKLTAMRKENAAKVQAIKKTAQEEINTRLQGLRDVRDSTQGRLRLIEEQAAQTLRQAPIGESLTWKTYQRKIAYYGTLSSKALVRGDYVQAAEMKERQLYHAYLAKHAVMQEQQVDKDIRRLRENLKRMTRSQQPIRLDTQARYFVHHLMYQLGLTGTDAQAPIDGFEMSSIEELLNPDVAFGMGGDPVISPALRALFAADGRSEKTWRQMPFETWEQTVQVLQAVYTAGRRMHDGLAIVRKNGEHVSIADAANELALKLKKRYGEDNRDLRQIRNDMTRADRMGQLAGELVTQLIKPEIIMNRLDGRAVGVKIDDDSFHRFVYDPIARAANRKREMTADAKRNLSRIFERRYSRNEMRAMRQERKYQVGNRKAYTKEEILTAALNWGAAENRKRVLHTFGVDEMTMNAAFGEILTAKDWDTVEKIWQFIDGYYEERSRVLERETGVPLGKVEAVPFTINGRKFEGGYYPIVYDPQLSQRASDMDVANELAKQMSSNAVFGAGLGATKKRQAVVNRELLLSLDVLPRAVNEAILHISMREAVLDVAHLLDHAALAEPLQKVIGQSQYRMLREWVRDTWREELVRESSAEQFANLLRRNSTFAVMAYRTSTALLNVCNIAMVAHSLGKVRTLQALLKFIRHPQRITRRVKEKSSFIAEREENLDRDLARDMKVSGKELSYVGTDGVAAKAAEGVYSAKEAVGRFGYWLITKTDLMFSLPTWQAVYEDTVRAEMERGELTAEQIDAEAVAKADEAVRRIWGSGEIQDQSKVQKGRIMKFFTPFYTFFSVVLNAHIEAGYALKDNGNPVPLMSTVLYWLFLQALLETALRGAIDAATGRGPDDDDDWVEYFGKEYLKNFVGTATGGIPGVNIAATLTMNTMLGEYYQGRGSQVVALRVMDELQDLVYAVGSDKRDWVDMGRSASRVGNRLVGFSDTLTDGFWTLLRVTCTESDATWDEAVADIIFDRKARKAK